MVTVCRAVLADITAGNSLSCMILLYLVLGMICPSHCGVFSFKERCSGIPIGSDPHAKGVYKCSKGNSIRSRCRYECQAESYEASHGDDLECHAVWDHTTNSVADAAWFGMWGYCIPFSCWDSSGLTKATLTCTKEPITNRLGDVVGHPIGTICEAKCDSVQDMANVFACEYEVGYGGDVVRGARCLWMYKEKTCSTIDCIDPNIVASHAYYDCNADLELASYCLVTCDGGYQRKNMEVPMCSYHTHFESYWNPPIESCVPGPYRCKFLGNRVGNTRFSYTNAHNLRSNLTVICENGYTMIGPDDATCVDTGSTAVWRPTDTDYGDGVLGECVPAICPHIDLFTNGALDKCSGRAIKDQAGSMCAFYCPKGFRAKYSHDRTLLLCIPNPGVKISFDGRWSVISDPCIPLECPIIPTSSHTSHLKMICVGSTYQSTCHFTCGSGYVVDSEKHYITCLDVEGNGEWSGDPPRCIKAQPSPDRFIKTTIVASGVEMSKKYLIYKDHFTWEHASEYCEGNFGTLAMPKSAAIHDWLVQKIAGVRKQIEPAEGTWVGMSDIESEGNWKFVDSFPVENPINFGDLSDGGKLKNYYKNISYNGQYWFVWGYANFCTYEECKAHCSSLSGVLPVVSSPEVNALLTTVIQTLVNQYEDSGFKMDKSYDYENFYINVKAKSKAEYTRGDGKKMFMYLDWYSSNGVAMPSKGSSYANYENWDRSNTEPNGYSEGERCVTLNRHGKFTDKSCDLKLPLICETRTLPFERWLSSGMTYAEPNNLFGVENCGAILNDIGMWNDFECDRKLPFMCEMDVHCPRIPIETLAAELIIDCEIPPGTKKPQCKFQCDSTLRLMELSDPDASTIVCEDPDGDRNGEWIPQFPNCTEIIIECPRYTESMLSSHTTLSCSDENILESTCSISCSDVTTPKNGIDRVICEDPDGDHIGSWSNVFPDCTDIVCPKIADVLPANTPANCTNENTIKSVCTVYCDKGLVLKTGAITFDVKCVDDDHDGSGTWDASPPTCEELECAPLRPHLFSDATSISCTSGSNWNSECTFTCSGDTRVASDTDVFTCTDIENDKVTEWIPEPMSCIYYPTECKHYKKDHSLECLNKIWSKAGCLKTGSEAPGMISSRKRLPFTSTPLDKLLTFYKSHVYEADNGNSTAQRACYGFEYLKGCTKFDGPHTTECLNSIWKDEGCVEKGHKYPPKLSTVNLDVLKRKTLLQIKEAFNDTASSSDNGDRTSQMNCYGLEYPDSCTKYQGLHTVDCLNSIWVDQTCLPEGSDYPSKLSSADVKALSSINLW